MRGKFSIKIAEHAGYCYGVERALRLTREAAAQLKGEIFTLGPIIHNPAVVQELQDKGIMAMDNLDKVESGTIIIRSHGVEPAVLKEAESRGLKVVDATCPFVKKAQKCARKLVDEGYQVVIVGERNHPEVIGIKAHAGESAIVMEMDEHPPKELSDRIGIVVQTTQSPSSLQKVINNLLPTASEIKVFNTICSATFLRQEGAHRLAQKVEMILVVGGKNSANTSRLVTICKEAGASVYHIENHEEIDPTWLKGVKTIGITGGASTPDYQIKNVSKRVKKLLQFAE